MTRMTGGEALVQSLYREGVRVAVYQLRTGRPRPVEIEMSPEIMEDEGEVALYEPTPVSRPAAPAAEIDKAAELLLAARKPIIYAGSGVHPSGTNDALAAA